MLADHVSIVVADVPAVAVADPVRASGKAMLVPVAAPISGVTRVGVLANTSAPVPVSSVTAEARFAEEGVPKNVATPVPKPETSLAILTVRVLLAPSIVLLVSVSVTALKFVPLTLKFLPMDHRQIMLSYKQKTLSPKSVAIKMVIFVVPLP